MLSFVSPSLSQFVKDRMYTYRTYQDPCDYDQYYTDMLIIQMSDPFLFILFSRSTLLPDLNVDVDLANKSG